MVDEGIVLGHKVSTPRLRVDRANIEVIENLPPPANVKAIKSLLGHAGFYRRFIRDFYKISKPLCSLLKFSTPFLFSYACLAFSLQLSQTLLSAPIL